MKVSFFALFLSLFFLPVSAQNIAKAGSHPYADSQKGRENWKTSRFKVNEARLYDFYQRQADYYLANPEKIPAILPAFPGLDGGKHGHWGKHNQNNHSDTRWNDAEMGEVTTQVFRGPELVVLKGICVKLGEARELSTCFDPMTLHYRALWKDGFVKFAGFRWGTSRNAELDGQPLAIASKVRANKDTSYLGYRRYGKRVVFQYERQKTQIDDEPWAVGDAFYRRLDFKNAAPALEIPVLVGEGMTCQIVTQKGLGAVNFDAKKNRLSLKGVKAGGHLIFRTSKKGAAKDDRAALAHLQKKRKYEKRWTQTVTSSGKSGERGKNSSYAVDTFAVPFDNPWKVVMQLSGIAFLPDGTALVSTLVGDLWKVDGLDGNLKKVTWSRFATGFNQPVGLHIDRDGIFVLDRGQIYRLHDENGDGEVDFYENYAHDFGGYDRSHSHTFGLHRTSDGAFHFTQRESILRTGLDRKTSRQASGVRNCMGIGGSADSFWVAPQEGIWTPASAIIEVNQGEFYGLPSPTVKKGKIAPALCYIPRGIDNSTGGMLEITSDKWGPFKGNHVGISYGSSLHYLILRDGTSSRPQGAVVPLEGEFLSGVMRGAFHPQDGQLYLVGLDGWGDYAIHDGCFHRVRYTGDRVYQPKGFKVHQNGIRIDFTTKLDRAAAEEVAGYFAQVWNYEYKRQYGSPEFSVQEPDSLGHDRLAIRSVKLLEGGDSIFVEMPELKPVMQLHLRMHLKGADGHEFKTDLFASPMFPSPAFQAAGIAKVAEQKPATITLRVQGQQKKTSRRGETGTVTEGARSLVVDAIGGLQYAQTTLTAKPGEALSWKLRNTDVMPHNLVLVKPGKAKVVGEASFKMLNDPKAGEKNYVPALPEVVAFIPVIDPKSEHTLHFRAPKEPGDYPYICTFPGHWQAMRGILRVK